ncbi:MAG: hypothetical protein EBU90_30760 [Proteobacteria bacterium]|nr:hypothetical protein [Pseudomonadota bacterium]
MTETCMCWGFECGDGWFAILDALCSNIQWYIDRPPRVKEKWFFLKDLWNHTVWNHILYPVVSRILVPESNKNFKGRRWKLWNKFSDTFLLNVKYVEPKTPIPQVVAEQVKEKYGSLRFYYRGGDDVVRAYVSMAESMSERTCETCGATDDTVKESEGGWISIRCEKCR